MRKPKIVILSGYGLNCEEETQYAFNIAGGEADIVHINDLAANPKKLQAYHILAVPGGFSYGDDTGSGKAYANKIKNHLRQALNHFISRDKLVIGICNGFQILTNLGLLPGALTFNSNARYTDRWVDLRLNSQSPWLSGIKNLSVPIAHGEGRFVAGKATLLQLKKQRQIAAVYYKGGICKYQALEPNPNGSTLDIASLTSENGKILGIMPHPERAMFFTQLPNWPLLKQKYLRQDKPLPRFGPGLQIFKNAINYFK